eukprot:657831-Amphidinium_carterae.1
MSAMEVCRHGIAADMEQLSSRRKEHCKRDALLPCLVLAAGAERWIREGLGRGVNDFTCFGCSSCHTDELKSHVHGRMREHGIAVVVRDHSQRGAVSFGRAL